MVLLLIARVVIVSYYVDHAKWVSLMRNAKCEMPNAKCEMRNAECQMPNAKCQMPVLPLTTDLELFVRNEVFELGQLVFQCF